jgi:hypothetical protein
VEVAPRRPKSLPCIIIEFGNGAIELVAQAEHCQEEKRKDRNNADDALGTPDCDAAQRSRWDCNAAAAAALQSP